MNSHQKKLLVVLAANVLLVLLFPPFDSLTIGLGGGRNGATFDAFYFVFDRQFNKVVNTNLLFLELAWLIVNGTLGWLLLRNYNPTKAIMSARNAVIVFSAVNAAVMILLPPFENYASALRISGTYFDGFYLLFGDKWQRRFYVPLLYLEIFWVLINAAVSWLLFRDTTPTSQRRAGRAS